MNTTSYIYIYIYILFYLVESSHPIHMNTYTWSDDIDMAHDVRRLGYNAGLPGYSRYTRCMNVIYNIRIHQFIHQLMY